MALQILPILQVIVILSFPALYAYPVYGTKRFGHTFKGNTGSNSDWYPYATHQQQFQQPMIRTQRYPMNYYEMYPEDRYYYPQEPVYYPRTSKYEVYQAVMPYYYADNRQLFRPDYEYGYGYGDNADLSDIEEEIIQDAEREQRENAQPIGHETYYENDNSNEEGEDNIDKINAAFLQNLIMSQMYDDGKIDKYTNYESREDQDVRELKELAKPMKETPEHPTHEQRDNYFQQKTQSKNKHLSNNWDEKRSVLATERYPETRHMADKVFGKPSFIISDRKPKATTTTEKPKAASSASTALPKRNFGQKEEVLLRPATPVRRPFSQPIMDMLNIKDDVERKRAPSVYDTIKHMLEVEAKLDEENVDPDLKPAMRKRIISSEDSLTKQLSVLKKQ